MNAWAPHAAWPVDAEALVQAQLALAGAAPPAWRFEPGSTLRVGACYVCFGRGGTGAGDAGDAGWAAAAVFDGTTIVAQVIAAGTARAPYLPGLLALREGPLLEVAVRALVVPPDVLLVDATGRDHPRRAGLALQLGAQIGLPTIGVTNRLLVAMGELPADVRGATSAFVLGGDVVGFWVRTRAGVRPLAAHAAWRTDAATAAALALACTRRSRTPEPLRAARRVARAARAGSSSGPVLEIELE